MTRACLGLLAAVLAAGLAGAEARAQPPPDADPRALGPRLRTSATGATMAEAELSDLAGALARPGGAASYDREIDVAQAYLRAGILDKAHEHFTAASRLRPRDAAAWDGLARVWRDSGLPGVALGDAYRAVHAAPGSPAVQNTLGTILQLLGRGSDARERFARALELDSGAEYARGNLRLSWMMEKDTESHERR